MQRIVGQCSPQIRAPQPDFHARRIIGQDVAHRVDAQCGVEARAPSAEVKMLSGGIQTQVHVAHVKLGHEVGQRQRAHVDCCGVRLGALVEGGGGKQTLHTVLHEAQRRVKLVA